MKSVSFAVFLAICILTCTNELISADSPDERFTKARNHYQSGRYEEAAELLAGFTEENSQEVDLERVAILKSDTLSAQGERAERSRRS